MRKALLSLLLPLLIACLLPLCALAGAGEINGCVFIDDGSGLYKNGGRTLADAVITLYRLDADGRETQAARVKTQADGLYSFTQVAAGRYRLRAELPVVVDSHNPLLLSEVTSLFGHTSWRSAS